MYKRIPLISDFLERQEFERELENKQKELPNKLTDIENNIFLCEEEKAIKSNKLIFEIDNLADEIEFFDEYMEDISELE